MAKLRADGGLLADKTVGDPWGLGKGVRSLGRVRCRTFLGGEFGHSRREGGDGWWKTWPQAGHVQVGLLRVDTPVGQPLPPVASGLVVSRGDQAGSVARALQAFSSRLIVSPLASPLLPLWPLSSSSRPVWGCDWSRPWVGTAGLATGSLPRRGQGQWGACSGAHVHPSWFSTWTFS